jgi:hypothetical protein
MSYCRFSDESDIYLWPSPDGIVCTACLLVTEGNKDPVFATQADALKHVFDHARAHHKIPGYAIDRLIEEYLVGVEVL